MGLLMVWEFSGLTSGPWTKPSCRAQLQGHTSPWNAGNSEMQADGSPGGGAGWSPISEGLDLPPSSGESVDSCIPCLGCSTFHLPRRSCIPMLPADRSCTCQPCLHRPHGVTPPRCFLRDTFLTSETRGQSSETSNSLLFDVAIPGLWANGLHSSSDNSASFFHHHHGGRRNVPSPPLFLFPSLLTWDARLLSLLPGMEPRCGENCVQEQPWPREVGTELAGSPCTVVPFISLTPGNRRLPGNKPGGSTSPWNNPPSCLCPSVTQRAVGTLLIRNLSKPKLE